MTSEALTFTVPKPLAQELRAANSIFIADVLERGLRELRIERALEHYARGGMSFGAAAREAGVSQGDLARQAYARGMEPPSSSETLAEILEPV
jgi:hypothetical protein